MTMKIYGHPWSTNTRKTLLTLAEKGHAAELVLIMIPKGEQKSAEHLVRHPFGKVPVLDHDGFVLYEARAINAYLERALSGPRLVPDNLRESARVDQWMSIAEAYFIPHSHTLIVEKLFRRYLGGEQNVQAIGAGREGMQQALDLADRTLASSEHLAGAAFSLADIHWLPYLDYLWQIGEREAIESRENLARWWQRVSARPAWQKVGRAGPQPYETGMSAEVIEKLYRS